MTCHFITAGRDKKLPQIEEIHGLDTEKISRSPFLFPSSTKCLRQEKFGRIIMNMTRGKNTGFFPEAEQDLQKLAGRFGACATGCVLDTLSEDRPALIRDSVSLLRLLREIWTARHVTQNEIWKELEERLVLAEKLRAKGIRARKGGHYRSTKLP